MTPTKRQSLDKQFLGGVKWDHAKAKGQVARQLFEDLLQFKKVLIYENLSKDEIEEKLMELH